MKIRSLAALLAASVVLPVSMAHAVDLEVTHWWTSGGEAAAVAEFAKAFDATGNHWVDGAIAGSGDTARPIMVSRITGGDPMGATQFNHGRQAEELVEAGLMRNLDDVAKAENWAGVVNPPSLLEGCMLDGHVYCVPVNIHAWQWLWLSNKAFDDAGVAGADQLDRVRRRRPGAGEGRHPAARRRRAGLAAGRSLQQPGARARRQGSLPQGLQGQGRRRRRRRRHGEDLEGRRRRPQDGQGLERAGLEPGDQHGDHRQGRRPVDGRLGAGRVPGRGPGRRQGL